MCTFIWYIHLKSCWLTHFQLFAWFCEILVCSRKNLKQARKGFRPPSAMKGIGYFHNLRIVWEMFWKFFGLFWELIGNFLGGFFRGIFLEVLFWRNFFGGFFWRIFLRGFFRSNFFGRHYLVEEINKEWMFLSRFWGNFVSIHRKKEEF